MLLLSPSNNDDHRLQTSSSMKPNVKTMTMMAKKNNKTSPSSSSSSPSSLEQKVVEVIEPGLVLLRSFIPDEECQRLAMMAEEWGSSTEGDSGFYSVDSKGKKTLNTGEARGRIYDAATRFPPDVIQHCNDAVNIARSSDNEMPEMNCTHLLLNKYTTSQGLVWHRDIYENDGKSDHPVVNMCVGASCRFGFKHDDTDPGREIILKNGDILLFGGRCRLMKHAVLEVLLDDHPDWMMLQQNPCRYSFTFRDSPEVLGREEEFKYFRVSDHLVGQATFEVPKDRKSFRGLPSLKSQRLLLSSSSITTIMDGSIHDKLLLESVVDEEDLSETQALDETETSYDFEEGSTTTDFDYDNYEYHQQEQHHVYLNEDDIVSVSSC